MARAKNLLVIMSDEHNPKVLGHAGHPIVNTPALDRLATEGTRFTAAYTPSPICVPARGAFITGQPTWRSRCWDNANAYDGHMRGWSHALRDRGHHVAAIGKLHFTGRDGEDYGFDETILPMHVAGGVGDVTSLIRDPADVRANGARKLVAQAGPGESEYTRYDRSIAAAAADWLRAAATRRDDRPWVLYVSLVAPHFPLTAPPEHYDRYVDAALPRPKLWDAPAEERLPHPWLRIYAQRSAFREYFTSEDDLQRALAGYLGLTSFLDENIGHVLTALRDAGLAEDTRVIYTSDHGDNLGARGLWGKSTMFEESAGIPMLLAGPDVPAGAANATPVTLCDVAATILDAVGARDAIAELGLPGTSLLDLLGAPQPDRVALSEMHSFGPDAVFMLRSGRHKYIHHIHFPSQLYDLEADPEERHDLAGDPVSAVLLRDFELRLRAMLDPEAVDAMAKADQAAMMARHGGEAVIRGKERMAYTPPPVAA